MEILVLTHGWIVIGEYDDQKGLLKKASVLRRWGTSDGLGELRNGPLIETQLDPIPDLTIEKRNLLFRFKVRGF